MAEKKKQHYVPRFYLKYFSSGQSGTHIGLYHFATQRFIREAELKNQSYANYFYGKDGVIEDELGNLETRASEIINNIISTNVLPNTGTDKFATLWGFTLIQAQRTMHAAKQTNEMINAAMKAIAKHDERLKDIIDDYDIVLNEPAALNLQSTISSFGTTKDLACKLIVNKTGTPFITSDHPVIKYNQFLEKRKFPGGRTGLATKGLQVFYPLSPKLLVILYDSKVYKAGFRKQQTIETTNSRDIDSLNLLQALNCDELVYFNETVTEYYLRQLAVRRAEFHKEKAGEVHESQARENADGTSSILMNYQKKNHETRLALSFIKETEHAKKYQFTGYHAELRNESLRNRT